MKNFLLGIAALLVAGCASHSSKMPTLIGTEKTPGTVLWEFKGTGVTGEPVIGRDGTLFLTGGYDSHKVYSVNGKTGKKLWEYGRFEEVGPKYHSIRVSQNTVYFISDRDTSLIAVDSKTGAKKWDCGLVAKVHSVSESINDKFLYIVAGDFLGECHLYALGSDNGKMRWKSTIPKVAPSKPVISEDGTVYFGTWDYKVYALDGKNGKVKWEFKASRRSSELCIASDGTVFAGASPSNIYALEGKTGAQKWKNDISDSNRFYGPTPVFQLGDNIFVVSANMRSFYAFDAKSGLEKWRYKGRVISPAIGVADTVCILESNQNGASVTALNRETGKKLWTINIEKPEFNYPLCGPLKLGENNIIYAKIGNKIFAIKAN